MSLGDRIESYFKQHGSTGLTLWKVEGKGWQANIRNADQSWRIRYGETASGAIEAVTREIGRGRDHEDLI